MATFTYEQFQQAAQNSGLLGQFSQADLALAQKNPDAGMSILSAKQEWANATTDEAKALANQKAESIRASYGEYTGGTSGAGFTMTPLSPNSFEWGEAPSYSGGSYDDDIADLWNQALNYGDFTYGDAPTYTSRWDDQIQTMIKDLLNREDFSYDPATDPLYQNYRKQYTREGNRAMEDALGASAAASGGLPSSYTQTAASQARNYYASQMTDKIPELYQLAYNKYLNDYQMDLSDLGVVQGQEATDYNRYADQLAQYNTDRNLAYNVWLNRYNMLNNNLNTAIGMNQNEFNQYLAQLDQFNTDRNFYYNQLLDEINSQTNERNEALNFAQLAGQMGDYTYLNNMGINTDNNPVDWERQWQLAKLAAEYGDYSGLQALGINPQLGSYTYSGGSSGGSGGGGNNTSEGGTGGNVPNLTEYSDNQVNQVMAALSQAYPNRVIPNFEWDSLVANGYTAQQLQAAGFTRQGGQAQAGISMPGSNVNANTAGALAANVAGAMVKAGITSNMSAQQAMQAAYTALENGRITEREAEAILAQYGY